MSENENADFEIFDEDFHKVIDEMVKRTDPKASREMHRKGLGKFIDVAILLRRGFQQSWQFVVVIQALWIFLGLSPQVSDALSQFGINISGYWIGILALVGITFFFVFGLALLLYGGSERSNYQVMMKNNPAQRMDYHFYKAMARWAKRHEEYHKRGERG